MAVVSGVDGADPRVGRMSRVDIVGGGVGGFALAPCSVTVGYPPIVGVVFLKREQLMKFSGWMIMVGLITGCQMQEPPATDAPEEKVVPAKAATEAPAEPATEPAASADTTPPPTKSKPTSALTETFFVVQSSDSENTYKIYGTDLEPEHTLITSTGFAFAKRIATSAEEVTFRTNFVEPSEDPAENRYTKTVPYGLYEVDRKVSSGRGVSTPGHVAIDSSTGVDFKPIAFGESHPSYAAITAVMHTPDFQSVLQWNNWLHVKTGYCHYLFDPKKLMLSNCPDYATGDIRLDLVFESGGNTYVLGESPVKGSRSEPYVLTQTGEEWKSIEPICHQCSM